MTKTLKAGLQSILHRFNYEFVSLDALGRLHRDTDRLNACLLDAREYEFLCQFPMDSIGRLLTLRSKSHSQLGQDRFVLHELDFKRNGYFVEFGATNGVDLSNTFMLERDFGWSGILAEPAKGWHAALSDSRRSRIDHRCVWSRTGEKLEFSETPVGEFSTITSFIANDMHTGLRDHASSYAVETVSLLDLLDAHAAPSVIDYLSIDTEGSEYEILAAFDFSRYRFNVITVEHNFGPQREAIFELLTRHGYFRKLEQASRFDDWYVYGTGYQRG